MTRNGAVVVVINNDNKAAEIEFDVSRTRFAAMATLKDRLGVSRNVIVRERQVRVSLPKRSVAIFVSNW